MATGPLQNYSKTRLTLHITLEPEPHLFQAGENQCDCIAFKKSRLTGCPDPDPITESMPQNGHIAVVAIPSTSSIHSTIISGGKMRRQ